MLGIKSVRLALVCGMMLLLLSPGAALGQAPTRARAPASAGGPDLSVAGRFALPWACDEGHRITWTPSGHWSRGKASGVAYDFSMATGTPLYAPADGAVYSLLDERPFQTNYGNYVELVTMDGEWLIRLAHLRDAQTGERYVKAGELIGHSGSSGVPVEHLHLELFVRQDTGWVRPDLAHMQRLFGLAKEDWIEDAILTNDGCAPRVALVGHVEPIEEKVRLGETARLRLLMRNDGLLPLSLSMVQVSLHGPESASVVGEARGRWVLPQKSATTILVPVTPIWPGDWSVERVTYRTETATQSLPAKGGLQVSPSPLQLVDVVMPSDGLAVGDTARIEVRVENSGPEATQLDDLYVVGVRPDGAPWRALLGEGTRIPPMSVREYVIESRQVLHNVGTWTALRIGYPHQATELYFDTIERSFVVDGPELALNHVQTFALGGALHLFLNVSNTGTQTATPDTFEVWGWRSDGETFDASQRVAPIDPGQSALIHLTIPSDGGEGGWRLAEAGWWTKGSFFELALPERLGVSVAADEPLQS